MEQEVIAYFRSECPKDFISDVHYLSDCALKDPHNKQPENYTRELLMDNSVMHIAIAYDPDPMHISVVQEKRMYNDMARVMSKFYVRSNYGKRIGMRNPTLPYKRGKNGDFIRWSTAKILKVQIDACEFAGYDNMFMSAHYPTNRIFERFVGNISKIGHRQWQTSRDKYWVCDGPIDRCAQWIAWSGENCLKQYQS